MAVSLEGSLLESSRSLLALLELRCISACTAACEPRRRRQIRGRRAWWCRRRQDWQDAADAARELQRPKGAPVPCGATPTESTTPTRRGRARVGSAPGGGAAGRGQGGGAWLPHPSSSALLDQRAIHNILFIKIGNDQEMANHAGIPNLVSEVSCALCSAVKSVPRSSVYTSFQQ